MFLNKIKDQLKEFHLKRNMCTKKLEKWDDKLVSKLYDIKTKRGLAAFAVPYALGVTALSIASIVAPLFDAFINFGLLMRQPPQNLPRGIIAIEFPERLAKKVGTCAKNALIAAVSPIRNIRDISYTLYGMMRK